MLLPEIPTEVIGDQVRQALETLGITVPLEDVRRVDILPASIRVTLARRNAEGNMFAAGGEAATIEADIRIRWSK